MGFKGIFQGEIGSRPVVLRGRNSTRVRVVSCLTGCVLALPLAAAGQQLEGVGVAVSGNVTQTPVTPEVIPIPPYVLATDGDTSPYDEVGYRLSAYARWRVGQSRYFVQPELAYTSTRGQAYLVLYDLNGPIGPSFFTFGHQIWRGEVAVLGGWHTGRHTYVLAGPVLAINQREPLLTVEPGYPATTAIFNSLYQSVERIQALGQVGAGFAAGRFDFNLRYEQSLTPYSRRFYFDGGTHAYRQRIRQGIFTAGFLLYKRKS